MAKKITHSAIDIKDSNGNWLKSYTPEPYVQYVTRAGKLWNNVVARCKVGGCYQRSSPTYIECINGFKDFQEFAEWCQHQYGYMLKDSHGAFWQLDKDIKVIGNKTYSRDTCMFVPLRINTLTTFKKKNKGGHPIGVHWCNRNSVFKAKCSIGGGQQKHLGQFASAADAHKVWQEAKIEHIKNLCNTDIEIFKHNELKEALLRLATILTDDLANNRETKAYDN